MDSPMVVQLNESYIEGLAAMRTERPTIWQLTVEYQVRISEPISRLRPGDVQQPDARRKLVCKSRRRRKVHIMRYSNSSWGAYN